MEQTLIPQEYRKTVFWIVLYVVTLVAVSGLDLLPETVLAHKTGLLIQYAVFCLMVSAWVLSSSARLYHPRLKLLHGFLCAAFFLILIFSRLRYVVFAGIYPWEHIFWYLVYLPTLMIPLLSFYMTWYVGRDEEWRMPPRMLLLMIPAVLLFIGILTNEWHETAFVLEREGIATSLSGHYRVTWLYFMAQGWYLLFTVLALVRLFRVSRENDLRVYMWPQTAVIVVGILYTVLYAIDRSPTGFGYLEPAIMSCTVSIGVWEACLLTGMIPNNRGYVTFFRASTVPMEILDRGGNVRFVSAGRRGDGRIWRTRTVDFREGSIRYREDVTELTRTLRALEEAEQEMLEANRKLKADALVKENLTRTSERMRLYARALTDTRTRIEAVRQNAYAAMTSAGATAPSAGTDTCMVPEAKAAADLRERIAYLAVPLAYIKRRVNLVLTEETGEEMPVSELHFCLRESVEALSLIPVSVVYTQEADDALRLPAHVIEQLYDAFEDAVEGALSGLEQMRIRLETKAGKAFIHLVMEGDELERQTLTLCAGDGTDVEEAS